MSLSTEGARRWVRIAGLSSTLIVVAWVLAAGPPGLGTQAAIVAVGVALLGLPHGALDHLVAQRALSPRIGRWWPIAFMVIYLALSGLVLLGWWAAPRVTLALFLGLSWLHFGLGDAEAEGTGARGRVLEVFVRGGVPVMVPIAAHPQEVGMVFRWLTGDGFGLGDPAGWGAALAIAWAGAAAVLTLEAPRRVVLEVGTLATAFVLLPPLLAFALYFCLLHSPRHMVDLAEGWGSGRDRVSWRAMLLHSVPLTLATLALAGLAWPFVQLGDDTASVLRVVFCGLAALTLPHMVLTAMAQAPRPAG